MSVLKDIKICDRNIKVEFEFKKCKRISTRANEDYTLHCSLPESSSIEQGEAFIKARQDKIRRALCNKARGNAVKRFREFVSGEEYNVLGKPMMLKVIKGPANECYTFENEIILEVPDPDDYANKKARFVEWKHDVVENVISKLCDEVFPIFQKMGAREPLRIFCIQDNKHWGTNHYIPSCQDYFLTFSYDLFERDPEIIKTVVVHEYAHCFFHDHSENFWALVDSIVLDRVMRDRVLNMNPITTP